MANKTRLLVVGSLGSNQQEFVENLQNKGWSVSTARTLPQAEARLAEAEHEAFVAAEWQHR